MGDTLDVKTSTIILMFALSVILLQRYLGQYLYRVVFLSFESDPLPLKKKFDVDHARAFFFMSVAYIVVVIAIVGGGSAIVSILASTSELTIVSDAGSEVRVDVAATTMYLFYAAIVGILVAAFARISAGVSDTRDRYGRSLVCALYWQVVITMSALLVFSYPVVENLRAHPGSLGPVSQAVAGLVSGDYIYSILSILVLTMLVAEVIVDWAGRPGASIDT